MRGRPLIELVVVLFVGLLAVVVLLAITAPPVSPTAPAPATADGKSLSDAWVVIRLSHPASAITLQYQGTAVPLEADRALHHEGMIHGLFLEQGRALFTLETTWADPAAEGYAEIRVEPDHLPARSIGFWGRQAASTRFELIWPEHE